MSAMHNFRSHEYNLIRCAAARDERLVRPLMAFMREGSRKAENRRVENIFFFCGETRDEPTYASRLSSSISPRHIAALINYFFTIILIKSV